MLYAASEDLLHFNTLGLRSEAGALVRFKSTDKLARLTHLSERYRDTFVLGGGSNVVLAPRLSGLVIKVETKGIRLLDETATHYVVEAQAGENWHNFVSTCVDKGWWGLENLALIPGTVGAAPIQNVGAYGVELEQRFHSVLAWDLLSGKMHELTAPECEFAYRDSMFKRARRGRWLIVAVRFQFAKEWQPTLNYPDLVSHPDLQLPSASVSARQVFDAVCDVRRRKLPDPDVLGNAGSFFKNPVVTEDVFTRLKAEHPDLVAYRQDDGLYKLAAGWMIDRAGWKGRRMGNVGVHDRQALIVVNYGGAMADDVGVLARAIRDDVAQRFGVILEQEPVAVN